MSPNNRHCLISNILCSRHWLQGSARDKLEHSMYRVGSMLTTNPPHKPKCAHGYLWPWLCNHTRATATGIAIQWATYILAQMEQSLRKKQIWYSRIFFYPPRPIIYLILFKDLFLTGLRFRNRNSQRGQPTVLAICSWHFLLASLHSLGQMFSIFCGLLISLSYCLFRAVLQDAWRDMRLSLGWPGPWFPTFFKGFLTTYWHTSF